MAVYIVNYSKYGCYCQPIVVNDGHVLLSEILPHRKVEGFARYAC